MRTFEFIIILTILLSLINLFFLKKRVHWLHIQYSILILTFLLTILVEKFRWQMVPLYIFLGILIIISIVKAFRTHDEQIKRNSVIKSILRFSGIIITFILLVIFSLPPTLLPIFSLSKPTGPMKVGTTTFYFRDTARIDSYADAPNKYREVSVRIWYPASVGENERRMPYMQSDEARYLAGYVKATSFVMDHFKLVKTDSYYNSTPLQGQYPIIFYSPSGCMLENTGLFQDLASNGYIVFSVGHPYWNSFYYDAQGKAFPFNTNNVHYEAMWDEENSDNVIRTKDEITTASNLEQKRIAQHKLNAYMPEEIADIKLWSEDLSFLLDEFYLRQQSGESIFKNINTESVGVIGFSKGGAAAGQFCISDERCSAGINLSGFMFGDVVTNNFKRPFMIMESVEEDCATCDPICEVLYENAENDAYMVRINNANHGNFNDISLMMNDFIGITNKSGRKSINGNRFLRIQNYYVLSFFNQYLKGETSRLNEETAKDYPEVIFTGKKTQKQ